MWYLSKHFLSSANISLSIHKNGKKIIRTVPLLWRGEIFFFDRVTILFHQCNNTIITYQRFILVYVDILQI